MKNADGGATRAFGGSARETEEPPVGPDDGPNRARTDRRRDRRREIERIVAERAEPLTIDALTDRVAEWESDRVDGDLTRIDLREQLHEIDLPSLERRGALSFDADRGIIRASERTVRADSGPKEQFGRYYALATGLSMGLFGLSRAAIGPLASMSPSVTTGVSLVLVTLVAVADRVKRLR